MTGHKIFLQKRALQENYVTGWEATLLLQFLVTQKNNNLFYEKNNTNKKKYDVVTLN